MSKVKVHVWLLLVALVIAVLAATTAAQPGADKPSHSAFYGDFRSEDLVESCRKQFQFVKDKCGSGSRGGGFKWKGETAEEDFKIFDLHGDLSDDEVKQVLE